LDVNTPATRGAVIQTILEVMGFVIGKTTSTFSDVPANHHYGPAIALGAFHGFVQGDTSPDGALLNRFRPDDSINRAEVSKIIALTKELMK
ncbi:MAG: S-layer homology domain-containing protein, partial [Patescibacteria group bacterium]